MKKISLSHAIGAFITFICAVALSSLLKEFLPDVYNILFNISVFFKNYIPFATEVEIGYAILMSILMFLWGIGYYLKTKD